MKKILSQSNAPHKDTNILRRGFLLTLMVSLFTVLVSTDPTPFSKLIDGKFQIDISTDGVDTVTFKATIPKMSWFGIGFGKSMVGENIILF
jgi:hypothetical protein